MNAFLKKINVFFWPPPVEHIVYASYFILLADLILQFFLFNMNLRPSWHVFSHLGILVPFSTNHNRSWLIASPYFLEDNNCMRKGNWIYFTGASMGSADGGTDALRLSFSVSEPFSFQSVSESVLGQTQSCFALRRPRFSWKFCVALVKFGKWRVSIYPLTVWMML